MSELTKIYDGMVFNMSTGEVISHGAVTYHPKENIAHCGGGGPSTQTTTSGFATEYKPEIKEMLGESKKMYDDGKLGQVAGPTAEYSGALESGYHASERQQGIEQGMMDQAMQPVDLSGMRAGALQQAQGALNTSQGAAGAVGGLGGGRQALNQASITNDLAGKFGTIDQQQQQMQMDNMNTALSGQGQGAALKGQMGQATMDMAQKNADSDYTALAQRIGLFSGVAPKEQTTNKTGGK